MSEIQYQLTNCLVMLAPAFIIADASCTNRPGFAQLLKNYFTGCTVTEVEDAAALAAATQQQWYDVVLTEIHLPAEGGFKAAQHLLQQYSDYRIILYAHVNSQQDVVQAFTARAVAFFNCHEAKEVILYKIKEVLEKGCCITPVEFEAYKMAYNRLMDVQHNDAPLTPREKEVLAFICKGFTNKKIAETLFVAVQTIKNHRSHIRDKTGCHNTAELIHHAKKLGL